MAPVAVLDSSSSQIWGKIAGLCHGLCSVSVYWPIFHGCSPGGGGRGWGVMCTIYININHPRDAGQKTAGQLELQTNHRQSFHNQREGPFLGTSPGWLKAPTKRFHIKDTMLKGTRKKKWKIPLFP